MQHAFQEILIVFAYSKRTQLSLMLGIIFFLGLMVLGNYFAAEFELQGSLAPLTHKFRELIGHKYDKVAWFALLSFLYLTVKCYRKDRKRLLGL